MTASATNASTARRGRQPHPRPPAPGECQRDHQQPSAGVPEPPGPGDMRDGADRQAPGGREGQRPHDRADRGARADSSQHPGDSAQRLERRPPTHDLSNHGGDHDDLEEVPDRLSDRAPDGDAGVLIRKQVADERPRPEREAAYGQEGSADADRKPDDRRDRAGEPECIPEPRGPVVQERKQDPSPETGPGEPRRGCRSGSAQRNALRALDHLDV